MKTLRKVLQSEVVHIASAAAELGLPPNTFGLVPAGWGESEVVPEIELSIWAPAPVLLTGATLYGARLHALVFADLVVSPGKGGTLRKAKHGLLTGDGPVELGGALGFVIKVDADTIRIASTFHDAMADSPMALSGTLGLEPRPVKSTVDTSRVYWETHDGPLGLDDDGRIPLDAQHGYAKRLPHSPLVVGYALVGKLNAGTLSAAIAPIRDSVGG